MFHHAWHVGLILLAFALQEVDDYSKASSADFRIIAVLVPMQVEQTNHQNKCLREHKLYAMHAAVSNICGQIREKGPFHSHKYYNLSKLSDWHHPKVHVLYEFWITLSSNLITAVLLSCIGLVSACSWCPVSPCFSEGEIAGSGERRELEPCGSL